MPNSVATETELSVKTIGMSEMAQEVSEPPVPIVVHPLSPDAGLNQYNPLLGEL